jgi:hypothetical protein
MPLSRIYEESDSALMFDAASLKMQRINADGFQMLRGFLFCSAYLLKVRDMRDEAQDGVCPFRCAQTINFAAALPAANRYCSLFLDRRDSK